MAAGKQIFETIRFEIEAGHTAVITLNRPERLNASNDEMRVELGQAWKLVKEDSAIRVAIVTGAGDRAFSVGQDVKSTVSRGKTARTRPPP